MLVDCNFILQANLYKSIFICIVSAVSNAHNHGVAHCDIKPDNILLNRKLVPILIDWGVSYTKDAYLKGCRGTSIF